MNLRDKLRLYLIPLSLLLLQQNAIARTDPAVWITAKGLVQEITASKVIADGQRKAFLNTFAEFENQHDRLEADEYDLLQRLSADQTTIKQEVEVERTYQDDRAAWRSQLTAHNQSCNRTFSNPADVARCDDEGNKLAGAQKALDAREAVIAKTATELRARQTDDVALATALDARYATWTAQLEPEFNAPARKALDQLFSTTTLRLTVKSFISVIDLSSMSVNARPRAEQTFAWFTNQNFSENPATPDPNANDFRLWSQAVVVAACRGNMITSWKTSNLAHRGGKELRILDAETSVLDLLAVTPAPKGNDEVTSLELSYGIRGKPNDNALSSFQWVSPRTCDSIWHRARAVITCRDGEAKASVAVTGSQFPSHRVWINNEMASPTLAQGPFSDLWVCNPSTPELVQ